MRDGEGHTVPNKVKLEIQGCVRDIINDWRSENSCNAQRGYDL
jgi:hypothetical protein